MIEQNFIKIYENRFKEYWSLPALTNYNTATTYTYANVAKQIAKIHLILDYLGINPGDKVALIGKDSAEWCMVFMGVMTYGAVIVPILPDFHKDDILHIIEHSDARMVFVSKSHYSAMDASRFGNMAVVMDIDTLKPIDEFSPNKSFVDLDIEALFNDIYPNGFTEEDVKYKDISNETVLLINYTSGTTGFSKGVIITANNLAGNVVYASTQNMMRRGEKILCFLPLAHTYSCAFNFLCPLESGTHVYILGLPPTPRTLLKAFKQIRPNLIISVPLILEKIYKNIITPAISKGKAKILLATPLLDKIVYKKVNEQLTESLGGNFREFIVGGAAMSKEVVEFLYKAKFPYTVGYGMTECAPLICYSGHKSYVPNSCGKPLKGFMEVRISNPEPQSGIGEIQCRGENVCKGYYKNSEETEKLFTSDGWMKTGDLGYMDKNNNVYIVGRSKTMLLGPNGQNIYTEPIEARLNMMEYIGESLVVMNKNKRLVALVYPDQDKIKSENLSEERINEVMKENIHNLNKELSNYEQVATFIIMEEEFEKTPKKSIKRFLYENYAESM